MIHIAIVLHSIKIRGCKDNERTFCLYHYLQSKKARRYEPLEDGWWLWLSWYSGRFRHQRSVVRIQSLEFFLLILNICLLCIAKTKIKKKEAGDGLFLKNKVLNEYYNPDGSFVQLALSQKDG